MSGSASLDDTLRAFARWLDLGAPDDAPAWVARLGINQPEIDRLRQAPLPAVPMYAAQATPVADPPGQLPGPDVAADAARVAWSRVPDAARWRAFTARVPEQALTQGVPGYLGGLPVAIKDLMAVAGMPLTGGTRARAAVTPTQDAVAVARLRAHGAVVIGTTNLHELAYGITSANPHEGAVVNPAAPDRTPGGSSGGTAAAIAAGVVNAGLGTDTAGSIRIPAACCGVVGFKPSYDAVPRTGGLDLAPTLDHIGPLGAGVADCAALFAALLDRPAIPDWQRIEPRGLRVGRLTGYFDEPLDASVRAAVDAAALALQDAGAQVVPLALPGVEDAAAIQFHTICAEATAVNADVLHGRGLGEDVRLRLAIGQFLPGAWYVKAQRLREAMVQGMLAGFAQTDLWITSTLRTPAPPAGAADVDIGGRRYPLHTAMTQLTMPFNLSGLPALSLPWGCDAQGVPLAVQIIGPRGSDWRVLALGAWLEARAPRD